ncbi:MAG: diadenylate cyclase CdaA [Candidatus Omnitrophica bacterium]|nr:diadenylate cyclase CdaA [Candidatus Omnitrophota bacterium]MBU1869534.1 diadenylate cyclase CdaA [Candidatus Omnitrophota bacterium]
MMHISLLSYWKPLVEIVILWFVIYHVILFFEGTRAVQVVRGIVILLVAFFVFQRLGLQALDWLLTKLFGISVIAILIIFQPEIRQGLAHIGQRHLFSVTLGEEEIDSILKEIAKFLENISRNKFGAIIAIEKNVPLNSYKETGEVVDGRISSDLMEAIFTPNNPLHDGGLIIQRGRISAAGCLFPLTQNKDLNRLFGTRHRAALGLSDETDAVIIVVSEERQDFSLVYRGRLYKDLSIEDLLAKVKDRLLIRKENE